MLGNNTTNREKEKERGREEFLFNSVKIAFYRYRRPKRALNVEGVTRICTNLCSICLNLRYHFAIQDAKKYITSFYFDRGLDPPYFGCYR